MSERIRVIGKTFPKIRDVSATLPRIEASEVAKALGAEPTGIRLEKALAPLTLLLVREKLIERLQSSGGRPALEGATRRTKIPLSDQQWLQLEEIAQTVSSDGFAPSPGQVASVLLAAALESVSSKRSA